MSGDKEPKGLLRDPLWDRQWGESRQAFGAFVLYRDLGEARTIDDAFRLHAGHDPGIYGASGHWRRWAVRWSWVERARAWDSHLDGQRRAAQEEAARADGERLAEERRKQRATELEMGAQLIEKARQMLTLPVVEVTTERDSESGKMVQTFKPGRWTLRDVARFVEVGAQLRRLALDMETSRAAVRVDVEDEIRQLARQRGWDEEAAVLAARQFADERGDRAVG